MQSGRYSGSRSIKRNIVSSARTSKEIPHVQIFLDSHIYDAINKIKQQSKSKNENGGSSYKKMSFQQSSYQSSKASKKQSLQDNIWMKKSITLMPNDVVLNYIKEVYQKYGIKNPFIGYLDMDNTRQKAQYLNFTKYPSFSDKKKILNQENIYSSVKTKKKEKKMSANQSRIFHLKQKFKHAIDNQPQIQQSTNKKFSLFPYQPANQINQHSQIKYQNNIKKSEGNVTCIDRLTHLNESQHHFKDFAKNTALQIDINSETPEKSLKHINKFYESTSQEFVPESPQIIKPKRKLFVKTRATSIKQQKNSSPSHHFKLQSKKFYQKQVHEVASNIKIEDDTSIILESEGVSVSENKIIFGQQIAQIYRYCLGCESAILQSNIFIHEWKCSQLRQIFSLQIKQIDQILQKKIKRLKRQLSQSNLINLSTEDLQQIKSNTSIILKSENTHQKYYNKEEYLQLNKIIQKKLLKGCEIIKKLSWFGKLKFHLEQYIKFINQANSSNGNNNNSGFLNLKM